MPEPKCASCGLRARYDNNPKSFLGRFWKWHIRWCPGWKSYMKSLPEEEKTAIKNQYQLG